MKKEEKEVNVHEVISGAVNETSEFIKDFEKEVCEGNDVPKDKFDKWAKSNPFKRLYEGKKSE